MGSGKSRTVATFGAVKTIPKFFTRIFYQNPALESVHIKHKILNTSEDFLITQRQTTTGKIAAAAIVHDGLAFISASATSGITVPDVVRHMNVSRRLADLRFRQATGKSILQTIIETKITGAKKLPRPTSLSVSDIARRCGFSSANYFKNVFVRTVGESPRSWRNSQPT